MSMAILKGRISERGAFVVAWSGFIMALIMGIFLTLHRGWPIVLLGLIGFIGGYFYTAPPFQHKDRALGLPVVFFFNGPGVVGWGAPRRPRDLLSQSLLSTIPPRPPAAGDASL